MLAADVPTVSSGQTDIYDSARLSLTVIRLRFLTLTLTHTYTAIPEHMKMRGRYFSKLSLDSIKDNTNPKTNPNPKVTLILTLFSCFMLFSSTVL